MKTLLKNSIGNQDLVQGAETTLYAALSPEMDEHSGAYLEDCTVKTPSKWALNETDQTRLWELTFHLLSPWIPKSSELRRKSGF